ncbi:MAG: methyltransferase domain-containing protein [Clostridia bacterium]|nr:methyltransferase domain-containing protein [Clostridia bacterium]
MKSCNYQGALGKIEDSHFLIGMVSLDGILRLGYEIGLSCESRVLDLCCGYGTVLKVWSEAFGIVGTGVDLCEEFINIGRARLIQAGVQDRISLICGDALEYKASPDYDVVIMSETFESIAHSLNIGKAFLKPGGVLVYHKLYSKVENPPKELTDFDEEVLPLSGLNEIFRQNGLYMIAMAGDTDADWERYVLNWSGLRNLERLRNNPADETARSWAKRWHDIYFRVRRPFEGQAMFALVDGP